jgi:hypothetical protein
MRHSEFGISSEFGSRSSKQCGMQEGFLNPSALVLQA